MFLRFTSAPARAIAPASLFLLTSLALSGCAGGLTSTPSTATAVAVSGNWQLASSAPVAAALPKLSGTLSGSSASLHGILHADAATSCVAPSTSIAVSGSADPNGNVTLSGTGLAGGTLTVTGTLAPDGKSLTSAQYNVAGGTCAFAHPADATAQQYADITGTYNGTFFDQASNGQPILTMTAQLTQSPAGDTDGNFTLTGTGQVAQNPCFPTPPQVVNSQVTGGSFSFTYADAVTGSSVTTNGTFSPDGSTLTITGWTLAGPCGPDSGTGTMVKQ